MKVKNFKKLLLALSFGYFAQSAQAVTVDWLVLYDTDSKNHFNGDPATGVQSWVNQINYAYSASGVDIQLRLVGVHPHSDNSTTMRDVLGNIRKNKELIKLRDDLGADFVTQLHKTGKCGIGYVAVSQAWAWNVVGPKCGPLTAAHELGHNMGLNHSRRQGNKNGVRYAYGLGYGVDNVYSTIMAYASSFGTNRGNRFSNPRIQCNGVACGVPAGQPQQADASKALQNVSSEVARFRPTKFAGNIYTINVDLNKDKYNYDFGTGVSKVQSGWTRISPETNGDISWSAPVGSRDRGTSTGVNNINRDFVFSSEKRTLEHKIASGKWRVVLNMGDADHMHDAMSVTAEGKVIDSNIQSSEGEFPYVTFEITVSDGALTLQFSDEGLSDPNWVVTRLSLEKISAGEVTPKSGTVQLRAQHSNRCLDLEKNGQANGTNVTQYDCHNGANQKWALNEKDNGYFEIKSISSGKCLDVGGTSNGANMQVWGCWGGDNQRFKLNDVGGGYFELIAKHSGKCLDIAGGNNNNFTNAQQWSCASSPQQYFKLN
ncbi:RICIN domain-containing protein [Marinagarivorans algicola]|uniref:RICIN domain-containing protein n=1 Tax=Marinagarivorans algicola TaxID=1513270 RepID=UPI0006B40C08|nr:RICIN domain-containing protein [Marinagarivorans algicola]